MCWGLVAQYCGCRFASYLVLGFMAAKSCESQAVGMSHYNRQVYISDHRPQPRAIQFFAAARGARFLVSVSSTSSGPRSSRFRDVYDSHEGLTSVQHTKP